MTLKGWTTLKSIVLWQAISEQKNTQGESIGFYNS